MQPKPFAFVNRDNSYDRFWTFTKQQRLKVKKGLPSSDLKDLIQE